MTQERILKRHGLQDQCFELQLFYRDSEQAENWMTSRETFLQADDNVDSKEDNVEAMIKKHEDFNKAIGNQEEKIESLQTYADQLIQSEHHAGPDINQKKKDVLESQRICIGIDRHGREETKETTEPSLPIPTTHDDNNKSETKEGDLTSHQNQFTQTTVEGHQTTSNQGSPDNQQDPANSTLPIDLGFPIMCNLCSREISSKNFLRHCSIDHNIERPNSRQHAVKISVKPDSIHQNHGKLKPGVVVASNDGDYISLEQPTIIGWSTTNLNTRETKDLESVKMFSTIFFIRKVLEEMCGQRVQLVQIGWWSNY